MQAQTQLALRFLVKLLQAHTRAFLTHPISPISHRFLPLSLSPLSLSFLQNSFLSPSFSFFLITITLLLKLERRRAADGAKVGEHVGPERIRDVIAKVLPRPFAGDDRLDHATEERHHRQTAVLDLLLLHLQ